MLIDINELRSRLSESYEEYVYDILDELEKEKEKEMSRASLDEAIKNLEYRKDLVKQSCPECWDQAMDWALDCMIIIRHMLDNADIDTFNKINDLVDKIHFQGKACSEL